MTIKHGRKREAGSLTGLTTFLLLTLKVILINVVLSADNAVVIALASRNLPVHQQKKAYLWGSCGVVILMILLTYVAMWLLKVPFLQMIGGLLLIWIAIKLLKGEEEQEEEGQIKQHGKLSAAIRTIIVADIVMSLDNTIAVAATAGGNLLIVGIGLLISTPLVILGSDLLGKLMKKIPWIAILGAAVLGYTAGGLILNDRVVGEFMKSLFTKTYGLLPWAIALAVLLVGVLLARKHPVNKTKEVKS